GRRQSRTEHAGAQALFAGGRPAARGGQGALRRAGGVRRLAAAAARPDLQPAQRLHHRARVRDHGPRSQRGGRLRGPAGPGLRGVLRDRRLRGRVVRVGVLRRRQRVRRRLGVRAQPPGDPHELPDRAPGGDDPVRDRRHPDRLADPAPARGLHRHRHPRLRRDHPRIRGQRRPDRAAVRRREPHRRAPGDHPRRPDSAPVPPPVHPARPAAVVLARARARVRHALRRHPPARLPPGPRVDRDSRGRGGRCLHGCPAREDQAVRLRRRGGDRRGLRRLPGFLPQHGQRRPVRVLVLDLRPGDDHPGRARIGLGRRLRRRPAVVHQLLPDSRRPANGAQEPRPGVRAHRPRLRDLRLPAADRDGAATRRPASRETPSDRADRRGRHGGEHVRGAGM
ncbi:MAG: Branched-chain amino acid transport system permease protein LivM, partial [uncultured Solirubrobacteraceae bacterium]